jgi:hypothetical protein
VRSLMNIRVPVAVISLYADARLGARTRSAVGSVTAYTDILRMVAVIRAPLPFILIVVLALFYMSLTSRAS